MCGWTSCSVVRSWHLSESRQCTNIGLASNLASVKIDERGQRDPRRSFTSGATQKYDLPHFAETPAPVFFIDRHAQFATYLEVVQPDREPGSAGVRDDFVATE